MKRDTIGGNVWSCLRKDVLKVVGTTASISRFDDKFGRVLSAY